MHPIEICMCVVNSLLYNAYKIDVLTCGKLDTNRPKTKSFCCPFCYIVTIVRALGLRFYFVLCLGERGKKGSSMGYIPAS